MDDLVDVVEGDDQTLEDMGPFLRLVQLILGSTDDDVFLMLDIVFEDILQAQRPRDPVDQGDHDDAEVGLHLCVLVELVQHHLRDGVFLEFDDETHALPVGLVPDTRYLRDLLLTGEFGDLLVKLGLVDLIGKLGHDETCPPTLDLLELHPRAQRDGTTACGIGFLDAFVAHDERSGREIRTGKRLHQLLEGDIRVVDVEIGGIDDLTEVVRGDVRGHTDGDTRRTVDQQVGEARRQNRRLLKALIIVGNEINGFLVEVAQQLECGFLQTCLRVPHGSCRVTVDATEVAMPIHQGNAHGEVLCEPYHRVIDCHITVGVVLADDLTDGPC